MMHSTFSGLFAGTSAAALVSTGLALSGPVHAATAQPVFSFTHGWRVDQHVRELADVSGDGRADIVGFGDPGTFVAYGQTAGTFTAPALRLRNFGTAQGWNNARHLRTVVDVDVDGRADLVGFGNAGASVSCAQPDGTFTPVTLEIGDFGYHQGWRVDQHAREVTDVISDGTADVVGFGYSGVSVAHGRANSSTEIPCPKSSFGEPFLKAGEFGFNDGWSQDRHPRLLGDVNGDGREDVVGFGYSATYVELF